MKTINLWIPAGILVLITISFSCAKLTPMPSIAGKWEGSYQYINYEYDFSMNFELLEDGNLIVRDDPNEPDRITGVGLWRLEKTFFEATVQYYDDPMDVFYYHAALAEDQTHLQEGKWGVYPAIDNGGTWKMTKLSKSQP